MNRSTSARRVEDARGELGREDLKLVEPGKDRSRLRKPERWILVALVLLVLTFVGTLAKYVFHPATTTLSGSSAQTWDPQGP